ncbi:M61 family metallopeptidase [Aquabacterium sp. OR-4]|uniref:M61 family metallopeptidase n=1 Tax=Aquabacterium sp. OR-4 TaxID=2978127 RepID=UPI0021B4ACE8|nr:PDZ domain-containing protein [Aquabacterium sp. OR-4]MDT7834465.1 PDZ domain-containing protein [Aquabacterium sp. OR-4]
MISYHVELDDLHSHHYRVTLSVPQPGDALELALPVWIPGSYLVREFARHLSGLQAQQGGQAWEVQALDKARWQLRRPAGAPASRAALTVRWRVYAFDTSVRTAFLDDRRGFFNGTGLLLRVVGREAQAQRLSLGRLPAGWEVATAMPAAAPGRSRGESGAWLAADYDELVDHPFELGSFWRGRFSAGGVPHELVVAGAWPRFDGDRLLRDTQRICAEQIAFWHGADAAARSAPFGRYVFLINAVGDGYGGLEHRASTALLTSRRDLPVQGSEPGGDGYIGLLGLISHEYFHSWNVKRLKPAEFATLDYQHENYTRLLWFFEGVTSYYDDLMLRRAGLIDAPRYLRLLTRNLASLAATPGRQLQSLAEASFDAWIKYYRPDENSANATVSYYVKGALVALALDLSLRQRGHSLDAVMRRLWADSAGGPVDEAAIQAALQAVAGRGLQRTLRAWVHGTDELPLAELLAATGVLCGSERAGWAATLGLKLSEGPVSGVQVKSVLAGSAAAVAGVAAGDELLAVDGWRIRRLDDALAWAGRESPFDLLLARDQRVLTLRLQPQRDAALAATPTLALQERPARHALARRRAWIDA